MLNRVLVAMAVGCVMGLVGCGSGQGGHDSTVGSVIFFHPDGASAGSFAASRALEVGPDGMLEWDRLPAMGLYRGHLRDTLTASSNGGATAHAYGVKPFRNAYGTMGGPGAEPIVDAEGRSLSVAHQALRAGLNVGLVQTGTSTEPGTGVFLASVPSREMHEEIAVQLVESGAAVMLGGGERYYLPAGVEGVHGEGVREDGRNLVEEAREAGYRVVYTAEELARVPAGAGRVLGLFASYHTFNDRSEEELAEAGLPLYVDGAPTVAEMSRAALRVLGASGERFLLVIEEEGTDNFGNNNNAAGTLEALRRTDEAVGVLHDYVRANPETLLLMAADSDGGGMRLVGVPDGVEMEVLPESDWNGSPFDGVGGTGTAPFVSTPDRFGNTHRFGIAWSAGVDVTGGILVRGAGLNSDMIRLNVDNTEITRIMRRTLFGGDGLE